LYFIIFLIINSDFFFGFVAAKDFFLIVWLSNLSILSVPDEGYSRNAPCALYIISTLSLKVFGSNKTKEEVRINN
jgi:hypothetical protein